MKDCACVLTLTLRIGKPVVYMNNMNYFDTS